MTHAGRGQVQPEGRAQASGADQQHSGTLQLELPFESNLRHDEMPAVSKDLFIRELHFLFRQRIGRNCHGRSPLNSIRYFGSVDPPAIEGTMLIVSPSLVRVFSLSRKRISSSFRYTFTKLRIFPSSV